MIMVIGQQHGIIQRWASEIIDFRFVRIMPDGTVSYSQRLTLKGDCPMQLQKFPFDSQANSLSVYMYMYDQDKLDIAPVHNLLGLGGCLYLKSNKLKILLWKCEISGGKFKIKCGKFIGLNFY